MAKINRYAPVLHTGFFEKHREGAVTEYAAVAAERGYSGVSLEGKSRIPTNNIDRWINEYHENVRRMTAAAEEQGIDVWLFDEWGYPSGTAAGKVIAENREVNCQSKLSFVRLNPLWNIFTREFTLAIKTNINFL